jgi:hypothetical protein
MRRKFPFFILTCLLCIQFFALSISAQKGRITPNCPMNIIIAIDFSGSEMAYLDEIRTVLVALTEPFELDEAKLKIGIITFNRGAQLVLPLTGDTQQLDKAIHELRMARLVYATDIHSAIAMAKHEFFKHSERSVSNYFVLISDGDPHAHARGRGWQADLINMDQLKAGDPSRNIDPIHVCTLYTGSMSPYRSHFGGQVEKASINHMKKMATDEKSFFYFEQYPSLVEYFLRISNCL